MKLENLLDSNINVEVDATNTVANGWEELTFDFSGVNNGNNYQTGYPPEQITHVNYCSYA